jgi:hypothetical protein
MTTADVHRKGVEMVLRLLKAKGFQVGDYGGKIQEHVPVRGRHGKPFGRTIEIEVRSSSHVFSEGFHAPEERPPKDDTQLYALVSTAHPSLDSILILTAEEAADAWGLDSRGAGYFATKEKGLHPDPDSVDKIERAGRKA